jgi:hypothetical protein
VRAALLVLLVAACAAPPPTAPITLQAPSARADAAPGTVIAVHNRERAAFGSSPLSWDAGLARQAEAYARRLAVAGRLKHSTRTERPGQGENLAMGSRVAFPAGSLAEGWALERRFFHPGLFPNVSRTRNWRDVGHFTQMVWPTTRRVGCGVATGREMRFLVCRYAPAGNIDGVPLPPRQAAILYSRSTARSAATRSVAGDAARVRG